MKQALFLCAAAAALWSTSCTSMSMKAREARILEAGTGREVSVEEVAQDLAQYDVVFLGELHDSVEGHVVMTELTAQIFGDHRAPVLSMEMFERDVQDLATAYVDGRLDRETFLASSRPWQPFDEHYGPVVDLARENGWHLIAANCPRSAARAYARGVHDPLRANLFASSDLDTSPGRYRELFNEAMTGMGGDHDVGPMLAAVYTAQVVKDETMADSITRVFAHDGGPWPRVVHWNGRFHSDWGLGTVERVVRRMPHLRIAVVSMERGNDAVTVARSDDPPGRYIIQVP